MPRIILILLLLLTSLDISAAGTEDTQPPVSPPGPANSVTIVNQTSADKATCAKKLEQYRKSQDCFAAYQNVNGTMKPGAFEHCTAVKYPIECPLN